MDIYMAIYLRFISILSSAYYHDFQVDLPLSCCHISYYTFMRSNMYATFNVHPIFLSLIFFIIYGTVMQRLYVRFQNLY